MPELTGFPPRGASKGELGATGYLVLKFLEHQWVRFFEDLLVEPGLALNVDLS